MTIFLDHQPIPAAPGQTILDAARAAGVHIPTLCHHPRFHATGSCMVCAVRVAGTERFIPACATKVSEGMSVEATGEPVTAFRRTALELLLSDHLGECVAMCRRTCPANLDVSRLMTQVEQGRLTDAFATLTQSIALPAIVSRLCHHPCETVCRRAAHDSSVAIRAVERYLAETARGECQTPVAAGASPIAIVGAGPTGLAAAWHLAQRGYAVTVHEAADLPLASLGDEVPAEAVAADLAMLTSAGIRLRLGERVGESGVRSLDQLLADCRAVLLAIGPEGDLPAPLVPPLFAAGRCLKPEARLIDRVAAGQHAAEAIHRFLTAAPDTGDQPDHAASFRSVLRRLDGDEMREFVANLNLAPRYPAAPLAAGDAANEAARCGHCECDVAATCELRRWSATHGARQRRHPASHARYRKRLDLPFMVFEPGKCILCGHCVNVAAEATPPMQLTLSGRGFTTTLACGTATTDPGLRATAAACVAVCPTGALRLS